MPHLFGAKLRHLRRHTGLTQADLAEKLALARLGHVSNLEMGRREPSVDLVIQVAELFGVPTDVLLRDTIPVDTLVPGAGMTCTLSLPRVHEFGENLRSLRKQAGMTQADLAVRLGLTTHVHISVLERGRKAPSLELLLHSADLFGVTTDDLLRSPARPDAEKR